MTGWRKAISGWLGYVLAASVLIFAARHFGLTLDQAGQALKPVDVGMLLCAVALFLLAALVNSAAFARLNAAAGVRVGGVPLAGAWLATLLSKYVPGGIWHVVGRGMLLARRGVPARTTALVGVVEQVASLLLCIVVAAGFHVLGRGTGEIAWFALAVAGGLLLFHVLANWLDRRYRSILDARVSCGSVALYALALVPYGAAYWCVAAPGDARAFFASLFAGTVAGVIAVPAPGGLGVRESVVALSLPSGGAQALSALLLARLLILVSECLAALIGLGMLNRNHSDRLYTAGLGLRGAGYPNAMRTMQLLGERRRVRIVPCGRWLPEDLHLWRLARGPLGTRLRWAVVLGFGNLASLVHVCARCVFRPAPVYVPYPAIFLLWWASLLPTFLRPAFIADAYISVWDSMFKDRALSVGDGLLARMIQRFEGRALRAARLVVTDTRANEIALVRDFQLNPSRVTSLPLGLDVSPYATIAPIVPRADGTLRLLFVGTLIPLHGVSVILDAARALSAERELEFRIVGDGQQAPLVEQALAEEGHGSLTWVRAWQQPQDMARELAAADICLGVFGGSGKAARVLPFKLYMYLAAGKAVISQNELSLPAGLPAPPILGVAGPVTGERLAAAILRLARDKRLRESLERDAREYFARWLGDAQLAKRWDDILAARQV